MGLKAAMDDDDFVEGILKFGLMCLAGALALAILTGVVALIYIAPWWLKLPLIVAFAGLGALAVRLLLAIWREE